MILCQDNVIMNTISECPLRYLIHNHLPGTMSTKLSAQLELCHAYARAVATFDLDALRTLCAPDITVSFLPKSFGAPIIKGIDTFLGAMTHVMGYGITEVKWEIDKEEVMESEGRVWFFVCPSYVLFEMYVKTDSMLLDLRSTSPARIASARRFIIR
jgi:ketosteroid isomerase-like protein